MSSPKSFLDAVLQVPGMPSTSGAPSTLGQVLVIAVNVMIGVGVSVSIITMALTAWEFILSKGDPDSLKKAYNMAFWTGVATFVTFAAVAIKNIAFNLLGGSPLSDVDSTF